MSHHHSKQIRNKQKNIIIRKGDPLYRIRFYPENLNDGVKLIKSDYLPEEIKNQYSEYAFNFVNNYFEKDFEIFGYKKYNSYNDFLENHFKENSYKSSKKVLTTKF